MAMLLEAEVRKAVFIRGSVFGKISEISVLIV